MPTRQLARALVCLVTLLLASSTALAEQPGFMLITRRSGVIDGGSAKQRPGAIEVLAFTQDTNQPVTNSTQFTPSPGFKEVFLGNSPKPRISIGIGVNWISPFGPLRLDLAKALVFQKGDDPKLFTFNVGTAF